MNKILKNIHWLFWGFIPIFCVYAFLNFEEYIDVNIHDTFILVSIVQIVLWQSILFFMFGLAYYLFYKTDKFKPIDSLSISHMLLTLIGLSILFFMPEFQYKLPIESTFDLQKNLRDRKITEYIKFYSALAVFIAQFLFIANFFTALFRK